jgi:Ca2+-binding EF-hand superfamily protein
MTSAARIGECGGSIGNSIVSSSSSSSSAAQRDETVQQSAAGSSQGNRDLRAALLMRSKRSHDATNAAARVAQLKLQRSHGRGSAAQRAAQRRGRDVDLGHGPLPRSSDLFLPTRDPGANEPCVWDMHGRMHPKDDEAAVRSAGALHVAMKRVMGVTERLAAQGLDLNAPFREIDEDGTGTLNREELKAGLNKLGCRLSQGQFAALWDHFDPDGDGEVQYVEFIFGFFDNKNVLKNWEAAKANIGREKIQELFYQYDTTGSGKLSNHQFAKALASILHTCYVSDQEVSLLMQTFDKDGDGCIDFAEFAKFLDHEVVKREMDPEQGGALHNVVKTGASALGRRVIAVDERTRRREVARKAASKLQAKWRGRVARREMTRAKADGVTKLGSAATKDAQDREHARISAMPLARRRSLVARQQLEGFVTGEPAPVSTALARDELLALMRDKLESYAELRCYVWKKHLLGAEDRLKRDARLEEDEVRAAEAAAAVNTRAAVRHKAAQLRMLGDRRLAVEQRDSPTLLKLIFNDFTALPSLLETTAVGTAAKVARRRRKELVRTQHEQMAASESEEGTGDSGVWGHRAAAMHISRQQLKGAIESQLRIALRFDQFDRLCNTIGRRVGLTVALRLEGCDVVQFKESVRRVLSDCFRSELGLSDDAVQIRYARAAALRHHRSEMDNVLEHDHPATLFELHVVIVGADRKRLGIGINGAANGCESTSEEAAEDVRKWGLTCVENVVDAWVLHQEDGRALSRHGAPTASEKRCTATAAATVANASHTCRSAPSCLWRTQLMKLGWQPRLSQVRHHHGKHSHAHHQHDVIGIGQLRLLACSAVAVKELPSGGKISFPDFEHAFRWWGVPEMNGTAGVSGSASTSDANAREHAQRAALEATERCDASYELARTFSGVREGWCFKRGAQGLGYYKLCPNEALAPRSGTPAAGNDTTTGDWLPTSRAQIDDPRRQGASKALQNLWLGLARGAHSAASMARGAGNQTAVGRRGGGLITSIAAELDRGGLGKCTAARLVALVHGLLRPRGSGGAAGSAIGGGGGSWPPIGALRGLDDVTLEQGAAQYLVQSLRKADRQLDMAEEVLVFFCATWSARRQELVAHVENSEQEAGRAEKQMKERERELVLAHAQSDHADESAAGALLQLVTLRHFERKEVGELAVRDQKYETRIVQLEFEIDNARAKHDRLSHMVQQAKERADAMKSRAKAAFEAACAKAKIDETAPPKFSLFFDEAADRAASTLRMSQIEEGAAALTDGERLKLMIARTREELAVHKAAAVERLEQRHRRVKSNRVACEMSANAARAAFQHELTLRHSSSELEARCNQLNREAARARSLLLLLTPMLRGAELGPAFRQRVALVLAGLRKSAARGLPGKMQTLGQYVGVLGPFLLPRRWCDIDADVAWEEVCAAADDGSVEDSPAAMQAAMDARNQSEAAAEREAASAAAEAAAAVVAKDLEQSVAAEERAASAAEAGAAVIGAAVEAAEAVVAPEAAEKRNAAPIATSLDETAKHPTAAGAGEAPLAEAMENLPAPTAASPPPTNATPSKNPTSISLDAAVTLPPANAAIAATAAEVTSAGADMSAVLDGDGQSPIVLIGGSDLQNSVPFPIDQRPQWGTPAAAQPNLAPAPSLTVLDPDPSFANTFH